METTRPSLLLRIRNADDASSWETFDEIYRPILLRFAGARGLRPSEAEDVAQDTLAAIHMAIADFEYDPRRGRFKGWLRTIVNNRVRSRFRHQAVERRAGEAMRADADGHAEPTEDIFDRIWLQEHLWHCMRILRAEVDARTYVVFERLTFTDATIESICEDTGVSPGNAYTIRWRLTRRIGELMRELAPESEIDADADRDGGWDGGEGGPG